ncbi:hypothetical protein DWX23_08070 [Parabacteroides sp. AF18-52]|jgi:hypothetical protein|nr:hypothetical protein DWX23_08070 [Parabacteroides sp. AF18-52]
MVIFLIFFILVGVINYIDYRTYKTIITPTFFLSVPFSAILLLCLLLNPSLSFVKVYPPSILIWIIGLFFFWLPGRVFAYTIGKKDFSSKNPRYTPYNTAPNKVILWIGVLIIGYFLLKYKSIANTEMVGSKEFGGELMIGGIASRLSNVLMLFFPYFVCTRLKSKILKYTFVSAIFFLIISYAAKTWMMNIILASFIVGAFRKQVKVNIKTIILLVFILFILFFLYYSLLIDSDSLLQFVFRHFYFYITSGILPMSSYIESESFFQTDNRYIIMPFVNMYYSLRGLPPMDVHSALWYVTDLNIGTESNVFSFFGTIYIYTDPVLFVVYSSLFGLFSYGVFTSALKSRSIFIHIIYAYNLCILFWGWYNCGYNLLRYWEIFAYGFILYFVNRFYFRLRQDNKYQTVITNV